MCLWTAIQDGVDMQTQLLSVLHKPGGEPERADSSRNSVSSTNKRVSATLTMSAGAHLTARINKHHR